MHYLTAIGLALVAVGFIEVAFTAADGQACNCPANDANCSCGVPWLLLLILYVGIGKIMAGITILSFGYFVKSKKSE